MEANSQNALYDNVISSCQWDINNHFEAQWNIGVPANFANIVTDERFFSHIYC